MRYSLLAVSVAILLTSAACHVHVDGTAPTARQYPPPTAPAQPPLSEVGVIYADHFGISEPDYLVLRQEFHLSDDDIGVVLFLSARSGWHWRRIAFQRRAGHDWKAITRMVGLTPVVYFVDVPRGAHLGHPYQGLYDQYWRYQDRPRRIHLSDADCVAMARLHLVRERYGYDPVTYMTPGPGPGHQALLQELERKRRTGQLQAGPQPKPLARETIRKKGRRTHDEVDRDHGPATESAGPRRDERGTGRGSVARGAEPSPGRSEPPGHAVSRSAGPAPGHGAKSSRVQAEPPGRSGDAHVAEHEHGREPETGPGKDHPTPSTKGASRSTVADHGPPPGRGAAAASNATADEKSQPVARGGIRGNRAADTAAAHDRDQSAGGHNSPSGPATTVASEQETPASHPHKGPNNGMSSHRPANDEAGAGSTHAADDPQRALASGRGGKKDPRTHTDRAAEPESVAESPPPAAQPDRDRATTATDANGNGKGSPAEEHAVTRSARHMEKRDAVGPENRNGPATHETDVAETHGSDHPAAEESGTPATEPTNRHTTARTHHDQSDKDVSADGDAGANPFADADADDPEPVSHRGAAGGDRSRGKP